MSISLTCRFSCIFSSWLPCLQLCFRKKPKSEIAYTPWKLIIWSSSIVLAPPQWPSTVPAQVRRQETTGDKIKNTLLHLIGCHQHPQMHSIKNNSGTWKLYTVCAEYHIAIPSGVSDIHTNSAFDEFMSTRKVKPCPPQNTFQLNVQEDDWRVFMYTHFKLRAAQLQGLFLLLIDLSIGCWGGCDWRETTGSVNGGVDTLITSFSCPCVKAFMSKTVKQTCQDTAINVHKGIRDT